MPGKLWEQAISGGQRRLSSPRGRISFVNKEGGMDLKYCPLHIHFKAECLKEYARHIHDILYEAFPFLEITFGKDTLATLPEEVKVFLGETGMDVSNNQE